MKNLVLIILLGACAYLYLVAPTVDVEIDSYQGLLKKVEYEAVSLDEIKVGANLLTTSFCNDATFQETGGSSVEACTDRYLAFKSMCEDRVFGHENKSLTNISEVKVLVKRFITCSGVS
ncbi:hypothetical protein ACPUVO_15295 [Pseudocolwellia sp. HL-MZ19]|uniref:hypothetical protein n=1 Tax=unclassified Pseudocolwellia TaxID=2848178 RepID=UPI003CF7669E